MGHWTISSGLEPVYVDDPWDNPNYDPRSGSYEITARCIDCDVDFEQYR